MSTSNTAEMIDPRIFQDLQTKIDEDADIREQLKAILQVLERQGRNAQSVLSRAHSTPAAQREIPLQLFYLSCTDQSSDSCHPSSRSSSSGRDRKYRKVVSPSIRVTILQVRCLSSNDTQNTGTMACGQEMCRTRSLAFFFVGG
jgi:hypothetical protein